MTLPEDYDIGDVKFRVRNEGFRGGFNCLQVTRCISPQCMPDAISEMA